MNGFKKTVLTATAVFVLGLGANAQAFVIDSFDTQQGPVVDNTNADGAVTDTTAAGAFVSTDLVGATRMLSVDALSGADTSDVVQMGVDTSHLSFSTSPFVTATSMVEWAGFGATDLTQPGGLGIGVAITVLFSDATQNIVPQSTATLTLTKSGGGTIFETLNIPLTTPPAAGTDPDAVPAPFDHIFTFGGGFAGATDITKINLTIQAQPGLDVVVDNIQTEVVPEPGTILLFGSGLAGLGFWRYRKSQA